MRLKTIVSVGMALFSLSACLDALSAALAEKPTAPAEMPALKVSISLLDTYQDGKFIYPATLQNLDPQAHFDVVIENVSSRPYFLSSDVFENADALTLNLTDAKGQSFELKPILVFKAYAKHIMRQERLGPGDVEVWEVYYAASKEELPKRAWEPFPFPKGCDVSETVTIRAVFEQKPFINDQKRGFWTGRVMSKPYTVVLKNNLP